MNHENKKLSHFITIFNSLEATEQAYIELEEYDVEYDFNYYYNANLHLSAELESTVDATKLTPNKLEKYKKLNTDIYNRLQHAYPQLYAMGNHISEIFYTAFEAAEESIEEKLKPYEGKKRPFFACGHSSFSIYIPEHTLLGIMLNEGLFSPENFEYKNGVMKVDTMRFIEKYGLTGQEYEIYEDAYRACLAVLKSKLKLKGRVEAWIS